MKPNTRQRRIKRILARGMGNNWSAAFIARQLQVEFEQQFKELMNMAEGDCVRIIRGIHLGEVGTITLIERQTLMVQLEGQKEPLPFVRLDLETVECPEWELPKDEPHTSSIDR